MRRILVVVALALLLLAVYRLQPGQYLSLENLKASQSQLSEWQAGRPGLAMAVFFGAYVLAAALSLPGAVILTLAAGALFGLGWGLLLVSFASTIGATAAFLGSRFLFRDFVEERFGERLAAIHRGMETEGAYYLFTLRLVPLFPFFLVNLLMGVTPIRAPVFYLVSQLGMLPGTFVYVNAGTRLPGVSTLAGILSPALLFSFALVGLFPVLAKNLVSRMRRNRHLRSFPRPAKFDYNLIVIGGGAAGLVSAYIAATLKARVALIEKHRMGGDCLNTGCVPSKALIRSAKIFKYFQRAEEFGFEALPARLDFAGLMDRVQRVVRAIEPHDSVERYRGLGVECLQGEARIRTPYEVEVNGKRLTTRSIVVASGASPLVPPIPGLSGTAYLTSETVWALRELPRELLVLGGGPIGCELAQSFARLGSTVILIERAARILAREDEDAASLVARALERDGVRILTGCEAKRFTTEHGRGVVVCERDGRELSIPFDRVLLALGRKANVSGFGLEELGIELSGHGTVVADEYLRTTKFPNIHVCGDVTGPYQFTHTAGHQAWFAAVNALLSPLWSFKVDYRVIPWCTFTDPELARVGLSEQEAREKGVAFQVTRYGLDELDRAIADEEAHGFVKVLTVPGSDRILGVTIVGHHAGDIIAEYVFAMKHGLGLNKVLGTIHIYPTLAEANRYAAGAWKRAGAPAAALEFLRKVHAWRRGPA